MKSFTPELIQQLSSNKEFFKDAIIESKGFILYLADKYTISLSPELLIETINPYSIRFISEHMKSQKYTSEQTAIVISYLTEENESTAAPITEYTLPELLNDIKEDKNLPRNGANLLHISFNDFLLNSKLLVQMIERGSENSWHDNEFSNSHFLLLSTFKNLNKEDFLKIEKETLISCPSLFHMAKHLMEDKDIKKLFNEVAIQYYKQPKRVKDGYKLKLKNYENYTFDKEDEKLFLSLLTNDYSSDYDTVKKYKGFDNFFKKQEYILKHNINGIKHFSEKEIADNLPAIRKSILNQFFKKRYRNLEDIYNLNISKDSFKDIFNTELIQEIIEKSQDFYFNRFDRDQIKKNEFMNFIHQEVLTLCSKNTKLLNIVGYQNCIENTTSLIENDKSYFNQTYASATELILENFVVVTKTTELFKNIKSSQVSCFSKFDIPTIIFKNMKGKESINYLFTLIKIESEISNLKKAIFKEEINRIIPLLNPEDVKLIGKILNYKIDNSLLIKNPKEKFSNNFLSFTPDIIKSIDFETFTSIFEISQDFRNMVLKNNLDYLIIDQKLSNLKSNSHDFILTCLNTIKDEKSPYFSFIKSFIKKNKDFILEHYFSNIVTHPLREKLINLDTDLLEQESYKKIENVMKEFSDKSLEISRFEFILNSLSEKDKKLNKFPINDMRKDKELLEKQINLNFLNISFNFYSQKIKSSDTVTAIELYNVSNNNNKNNYKNLIIDKIETLDFKTTKNLLNNKNFLNFIFDNSKKESNSSKEKIKFLFFNKNFSEKENIEIVETLLTNFNNPDLFLKIYEKKISLSRVLSLIEDGERYKISNDLAVKHDMVALFNSYDYLPNESGYFLKNSNKTFNNEQILSAIDNLNAQGLKIISHKDQNLSHDNLLSHNYKYEKRDGKNPQLKNYLDLLKSLEKDPINYLACIHSDIITNFTDESVIKIRDLAITDFYNRYINIDVVINAMKDIFSIHKEMSDDTEYIDNDFYKGIAVKNAVQAVASFISYSYANYDDKKSSELTEEKSIKILKTIIKEAPYFFFSTSSIGKIFSTDQEFQMNFNDYYHKDFIEDFFIQSSKTNITKDHFTLNYDKKDKEWQSVSADELIINLIKNLTEQQDFENLYKLDFIIKENQFNEDRPYGKKLTEFNSILAEFLSNKEYEKFLEKSLGYIKMIKLTEKLDSKPRFKVKANKI